MSAGPQAEPLAWLNDTRLPTSIGREQLEALLGAGALNLLFGPPSDADAATLRLQIDGNTVAPDRAVFSRKGAVAGLKLGRKTPLELVSLELVCSRSSVPDQTRDTGWQARLTMECPPGWTLVDSFPGLSSYLTDPASALHGLDLAKARLTVCGGAAPAGGDTLLLHLDAKRQDTGVIALVADLLEGKPAELTVRGDIALPLTRQAPIPAGRSPPAQFAGMPRSSSIQLQCELGRIDLSRVLGFASAPIALTWHLDAPHDLGWVLEPPQSPPSQSIHVCVPVPGGQLDLSASVGSGISDELVLTGEFRPDVAGSHRSALDALLEKHLSFEELLPEGMKRLLDHFALAKVALSLVKREDGGGIALAGIAAEVALRSGDGQDAGVAWDAPAHSPIALQLQRMQVVVCPGVSGMPSSFYVQVEGKCELFGAELKVTVGLPAPTVQLVQIGGQLNVAELFKTWGNGLELGTLAPQLDHISVCIDVEQRLYAASLTLKPGRQWSLGTEKEPLHLPEVTVELRGDGWRIDAHAPKDDDGIPVVRLLRQLALHVRHPATEDHLSLACFEVPTALADLKLRRISLRRNAASDDLVFEGEGRLPLAASNGAANGSLDLRLWISFRAGGAPDLGGQLRVDLGDGKPIECDLAFSGQGGMSLFVADWDDATQGGHVVRLAPLLAALSGHGQVCPDDIADLGIALRGGILAAYRPGPKSDLGLLLGVNLGLNLSLSAPKIPSLSFLGADGGKRLSLGLQVAMASRPFDAEAVQAVRSAAGAARFLPAAGVAQGLTMLVTVDSDDTERRVALPLASGAPGTGALSGSSTAPGPALGETSTAGGHWIDVHRSFGPLTIARVGADYRDGRFTALLDASLGIAGLTVSLDGLAVSSPIAKWEPAFDVAGLGLDYRNDAVEIGGALRRQPVVLHPGEKTPALPGFAGSAVVRAQDLTLAASGLYVEIDGEPSLFIYAVLDHALGGPPFFFVTGLAAGLGYHRRLNIPSLEQLATFPLIALARPVAEVAASSRDPVGALQALSDYLPPAPDASFLAAGVRFTSFRTIDSFALLVVRLSHRLEFDLLGVSSLVSPPRAPGLPATTPLAEAHLALRATFVPEDGLLDVRALLAPGSYVLSRQCALSGGFALCSWSKDLGTARAGDFVATLGGYHPDFKPPPHYPLVPRLQLLWQVNDHLSIKGSAYYALTGQALMAGGQLEAVWTDADVQATFVAAADFLLGWQPFHYDARMSVLMRAEVTLHAFGTHHLTFDAGADLHLWGPEFSGSALVQLRVLSFDVAFNVAFGDAPSGPEALTWESFRDSFLPKGSSCAVALRSGLVRTDAPEYWIVEPARLEIEMTSAVPEQSSGVATVGIRPMGLAPEALKSSFHFEILRDGENVTSLFEAQPVTRAVPTALWGSSRVQREDGKVWVGAPRLDEPALVVGATVGRRLRPRGPVEIGTKTSNTEVAGKTSLCTFPDVFDCPIGRAGPAPVTPAIVSGAPPAPIAFRDFHRPTLRSGTYRLSFEQRLVIDGDQCPPDRVERSFSVSGPRFTLDPQDIAAIYPPDRCRGPFDGVLPHVMFTRSTLPWERSPCAQGHGQAPESIAPWLALLVVHEDEEPHVLVEGVGAESANPVRLTPGRAADFLDPTALPGVPALSSGLGDRADEPLQTLVLDHALAQALLPADTGQLARRAHVRESDAAAGAPARSVVMAGRALQTEHRNTLYLVSLEGRYGSGGKLALLSTPVRLVCLKSWQFESTGPGVELLQAQVKALDIGNLALGAAPGMGRAPAVDGSFADGAVLLDSRLGALSRQARYRGPFVARLDPRDGLPPSFADLLSRRYAAELHRRAPGAAVADVSYAAAWELGRLLMLSDREALRALHAWKRSVARPRRQANTLWRAAQDPAPVPFPTAWFDDLAQLRRIPFTYLVPHDALVPYGSMRVFAVDRVWVDCLIAGACSLGATTDLEFNAGAAAAAPLLADLSVPACGLFLHSSIVSDWHSIDVKLVGGKSSADVRRLSKTLLLVLGTDWFNEVDLNLPPQALHYSALKMVEHEFGAADAAALAAKVVVAASGVRVTGRNPNGVHLNG